MIAVVPSNAFQVVAELRRQHRDGLSKVSGTEAAVMKTTGAQVEAWAARLPFALAGTRADGSAYPFSRWADEARTYSSAITQYTGEASRNDWKAALGFVAKETVKEVKAAGVAVAAEAVKGSPFLVIGALAIVGLLGFAYLRPFLPRAA